MVSGRQICMFLSNTDFFLTRARVAAAIALMHCHICVEAAGVRNKFVTDNNNTQAGATGGQHFFLGSIR